MAETFGAIFSLFHGSPIDTSSKYIYIYIDPARQYCKQLDSSVMFIITRQETLVFDFPHMNALGKTTHDNIIPQAACGAKSSRG